MNIVIISTGDRSELLYQTLRSCRDNAANWSEHTLTLVYDGCLQRIIPNESATPKSTVIHNLVSQGASASRNIGAASIPKYRRQDHVMFLDDDVYMCKGWDTKLMELAKAVPNRIVSGHAHPFNHGEFHTFEREVGRSESYPWEAEYTEPLVISTVCMMMPWTLWDDVGYFTEPGGPGGSEDYDYCMRAKDKYYGFAVTEPQCVLHTGVTSSSGKPIVGADLVRENNARLEKIYGIEKGGDLPVKESVSLLFENQEEAERLMRLLVGLLSKKARLTVSNRTISTEDVCFCVESEQNPQAGYGYNHVFRVRSVR